MDPRARATAAGGCALPAALVGSFPHASPALGTGADVVREQDLLDPAAAGRVRTHSYRVGPIVTDLATVLLFSH